MAEAESLSVDLTPQIQLLEFIQSLAGHLLRH
jgi:hypothetical protein